MALEEILEKIKSQKKHLYLILGIAGALVVIYVLYLMFFSAGGAFNKEPALGPTTPVVSSVTVIEQLTRDLSILTDPIFKTLRLPIELPIQTPPTGRDNPFNPF